jgi:DNA-directed RNA polymerase specialized sigma24 family protein
VSRDDEDITGKFLRAKQGDADAFAAIFHHFYRRLCGYIRTMLTTTDQRQHHEEDLANHVMSRVWEMRNREMFDVAQRREEIWQAICRVAIFDTRDRARYVRSKKRNVEDLGFWDDCNSIASIRNRSNHEREFEISELWRVFWNKLPDDSYREIVRLSLAGISKREIAEKLNTTERTINRRIEVMVQLWQDTCEPSRR